MNMNDAPDWLPAICLTALLASWIVIPSTGPTPPLPAAPERLTAEGLENLWALPLGDGRILYSGGQPSGAAGFHSLQSLGVRTILSVDGARPDVETAKKLGLRYVHLPIGYDDVPPDQLQRMIRAVQALPGPVYVHCHHGKHRGPASAVCIWRNVNTRLSGEAAADVLREMGTAGRYQGLYRAVRRERIVAPPGEPSNADLPEITPAAPLAEQMVAIDQLWEEIRTLAKRADPTPNEAGLMDEHWTDLAERFRESARLLDEESGGKRHDLARELQETAEILEPQSGETSASARWAWQTSLIPEVESRCSRCHAEFRD